MKHFRTAGLVIVVAFLTYCSNGQGVKTSLSSETTSAATPLIGMTRQDFNNLIVEDKVVLVDFYAPWCGPCKMMDPSIAEISKEMVDKVVVVRINTDDNRALCEELNIDAIPVLQVYKNKVLTWKYTGYIEKETIVKKLR